MINFKKKKKDETPEWVGEVGEKFTEGLGAIVNGANDLLSYADKKSKKAKKFAKAANDFRKAMKED